MRATDQILLDSKEILVSFIEAELDTAMLFATLAINSGRNLQKRARTASQARIACEAANRFLGRAEVSPAAARRIADRIVDIKHRLEQLDGSL